MGERVVNPSLTAAATRQAPPTARKAIVSLEDPAEIGISPSENIREQKLLTGSFTFIEAKQKKDNASNEQEQPHKVKVLGMLFQSPALMRIKVEEEE